MYALLTRQFPDSKSMESFLPKYEEIETQPPAYSSNDVEMASAQAPNAGEGDRQRPVRVGHLSSLARAPVKIVANALGAIYGGIGPVGSTAAVTAMGAAVLHAAGHEGYDVREQALQSLAGSTAFVGVRMLQGLYKEGKAYIKNTNTRPGIAEDVLLSFVRGNSTWINSEGQRRATIDTANTVLSPVIGDAMFHGGHVGPSAAGHDFASVFTGIGVAVAAVEAYAFCMAPCIAGLGYVVVKRLSSSPTDS